MNTEQLQALDKDIWDIIPKGFTKDYDYYEWEIESRHLTVEELIAVKQSCKEYVVAPIITSFGFGISLFDHPYYPGIEPEQLIKITINHLGDDKKFVDGWKELMPLADTNKNKTWLKLYGFENIRPEEYYKYWENAVTTFKKMKKIYNEHRTTPNP